MEPSATFCCVQCRLLQPPTTACAECGAPMTAPVELVRELLHYRDMSQLRTRDWRLLAAFVAGSSLAVPPLAPLAIGAGVVLALQKLRAARRQRVIAGIALPPLPAVPGATTVYGIARRFRGTVSSLIDEAPVLAEHVAIKDPRGAVLLRRTTHTPFLLELAERGPVLIAGVTRVTAPNMLAQRIRVRPGDPRLERMGVPPDLAIAGELEIATIAADGPHLAVTGILEDEAVAELAFHRDGGTMPVMRGRVGAPVLVGDRRLIAAAL